MALSADNLKGLIITELTAAGFATAEQGKSTIAPIELWAQAIANAVVDHITAAAEVKTTSGAPDSEHTGEIL